MPRKRSEAEASPARRPGAGDRPAPRSRAGAGYVTSYRKEGWKETPAGKRAWQSALWRGRVTVAGEVIQVYAPTEKEAWAKLDQAKAEATRGYRVSPGGRTVGDVLECYIVDCEYRGRKPATLYYYRQALTRYTPAWLQAVKLAEAKPEHFRRAQADLAAGKGLSRPLSATTIRNTRILWNAGLTFAVQNEWLTRNPLAAVKAPAPVRAQLRWPSPAEMTRLFDAAEAADDRLAALWTLAGTMGCRPGELLGLRWADVDLKRGTLAVRRTLVKLPRRAVAFGAPKTDTPRPAQRLAPDALEALRRHRARQAAERLALGPDYDDRGLVFCLETGAPLLPRHAARRFKQALERAGLPATIRFYDLRHGNATVMLSAGIHPRVAAERMGHSSAALFNRTYAHVSAEMDAAAADRIQAAFAAARGAGAATDADASRVGGATTEPPADRAPTPIAGPAERPKGRRNGYGARGERL